jgi:ABC-type transport system substrate-binding protein
MAADEMPSSVEEDGAFYSASVALRSDLKWTDGSPLTADDVAFTVNTALSFQLGFDWHDFYNPDWLDHAEAVDAHTVKFYFKKQPNVGVWQYGALQGPVVQKAFWEPKVALSVPLLPSAALAPRIEALRSKVDGLQKQVEALTISIASTPMPPRQTQQAQTDLRRKKNSLNEANNDLASAQADFDSAMNAARQWLYALDDRDEPTLGNWMPAGEKDGAWTNEVNPAHPFGQPKFNQAIYQVFSGEDDATTTFLKGEADLILEPSGSLARRFSSNKSIKLMASQGQDETLLVLNSFEHILSNPALRQALACITNLDSSFRENNLLIGSFVLPSEPLWYDPRPTLPCNGLDDTSRLSQAVHILKAAGYRWEQEPTGTVYGEGLKLSSGESFPALNLLVGDQKYTVASAVYLELHSIPLGIHTSKEVISAQEVNYAVFSSHQYDMAILGWQVGEYPGYLCDWFGDGNPFGYHSDRLQSACGVLNSTTDLDVARKEVFEIQSILAQDLPFIPLYSGVTYDAYRNISYPFDSVPGGLSGIYGAPSLAVPASQ